MTRINQNQLLHVDTVFFIDESQINDVEVFITDSFLIVAKGNDCYDWYNLNTVAELYQVTPAPTQQKQMRITYL